MISYEIRKNAATILHYPCDAIIMKIRPGWRERLLPHFFRTGT